MTNARLDVFSLQVMKSFEDKANLLDVEIHHLSLTSIHSGFLEIMPIHNGCLDALYLPPLLHL